MIEFRNDSIDQPYIDLREYYKDAILKNQPMVEAILIASYDKVKKEVDARYVNLKIIDNNNFIFFSNYNSPKSKQFSNHRQITAILFWSAINVQIRMKATISKLSSDFSDQYFKKRDPAKNALAISSRQSEKIKSYSEVEQNFKKALLSKDLSVRPEYWGGFSFKPYYFEFWKGDESRVNKRVGYELINDDWQSFFLQP